MKKTILGVAFAIAVAVGIAEPAQAYTGTMSYSEFTYIYLNETINQVSGDCSCTGQDVNSWTQNGRDFDQIEYMAATPGLNTFITYRFAIDGSNQWKARHKYWCNAGGCTEYSMPTG